MKVDLIDVMGDDLRVVNSARVSFDKESDWEDGEREYDPSGAFYEAHGQKLGDKDIKLLNYLAKHGHWTPFSHVQITMRETVPIFIARQRFKHMVGFTYNEVSRRYVSDEPSFFVPESWRKAADNVKQGSSDETIHEYFVEDEQCWSNTKDEYAALIERVQRIYKEFVDAGVAPEQARMILPQSMYTSYYTTGSLAAWARAYKQRIDSHAQKEIQDLAKQWGEVFEQLPQLKHSWEALTNN